MSFVFSRLHPFAIIFHQRRFPPGVTKTSLHSSPWPRGIHLCAARLNRGACRESGPASCSAQRPWHFRISRPPCLNPSAPDTNIWFLWCLEENFAGKTDLKFGQSAARLRTGWEHLLPMEHSGQDRPRVRTSKVNFENFGFVRQDAVFKQDGRFST